MEERKWLQKKGNSEELKRRKEKEKKKDKGRRINK